jgi:hypothetical protein
MNEKTMRTLDQVRIETAIRIRSSREQRKLVERLALIRGRSAKRLGEIERGQARAYALGKHKR